ncbi:MAG: SPOR domain-containing protein [Sulfuricurvum sp.]|uniref:SPOR domain-containing protein n=1 Tax=Sulfuricurvum sp. TaxID=2025608 RepID=UPI0026079ADC|nr:SPOR domain-containing protein [Sulfuricurvum sp.]MDD2829071.1 SPOR domain-containing protein [Sulfuricurvum sp.]MDD4948819.1 SPOR domain-containing protein [Sulfuricurvum sp.]
MEEKNELNDIILNKGGSGSGSKKLLLAIATLTLILIIVLVIMNSLKKDEVQKAPQAVLPPEPTAPTEIINDPLFEPVEVIQEGNETNKSNATMDLNKVAQKIKEESLKETPVASVPVAPQTAPAIPKTVQAAPAVQKVVPVAKPVEAKPVVVKTPKTEPIKAQPAIIKQEAKKAPAAPTPKPAVKAVEPKPAVATPATATEPVKQTEAKAEAKTVTTSGTTYFVQVGSFEKEPDKALFSRLNASGMKYTTQKSGDKTKVLVGPFQGEKAVQDAIGNIRQNIEAKAFRIKG